MSVKERKKGGFMHPKHLGECSNHSYMTRQPMEQGIGCSFDIRGLPVPILVYPVSIPKLERRPPPSVIRVHKNPSLTCRQELPQLPTQGLCAIRQDVSGRPFTVPGQNSQLQRHPEQLSSRIAPEFIKFEHQAYHGAGRFNRHRARTTTLQEPM